MASKEIIEYLFKANPTDLLQGTKKVKGGLQDVDRQADKTAAGMNQSFSKMAAGFQKVGQKMQTTGRNLTVGVTLPLAYALKRATDEAIAEERSLGKLESALGRTTSATRKQLDAVNDYIAETEVAVAISDEELRPAFERLARSTGDVEEAQDALNIAIDASRQTGKDLSTITEAMGKAFDGNVGALGRLGIATRDAEGNMLTMQEVLANMEQNFAGAAADYMDSAAGQAELAAINFGNLQEQIGKDLVPVMQDLAEIVSTVVNIFKDLPDWLQKSIIAFGLFKGPIMWIGGAGVKLIGAFVTKLIAMQTAAATAAGAVSGVGTAAAGAASGGMAALGAGAGAATTALGFKAGLGMAAVKLAGFLGQGLGLARVVQAAGPVIEYSDKIGESWGRLEDVGFTLGGTVKEVTGFFADLLDLITGPGLVREGLGYVDTVAGWIGINSDLKDSFNDAMPPVRDFYGLFANGQQGDDAPDDVAYRWATGFKFFNDMIADTPGLVDPAREEIIKMAQASGRSEEEIEALNTQLENFTSILGVLDKDTNAERSMVKLGDALDDYKAKMKDAEASTRDKRDELWNLQDQLGATADAMVNSYIDAVQYGRITDEEAAVKKEQLLAALARVKAEAPETAGKVDILTDAVNSVPVRRQIKFELVGVEDVLRGVDRMSQRFQNLSRDAANAGRSTVSVPDAFRGGARGALGFREAGGTMGFARGGVYGQNTGGGITAGMTYVIGEGRNPREYVIPTDPQYSRRAQTLLSMASAELGVPRQMVSSTFAPVINVTGGSDPQATAAAVADAVEQAFARKKRREGSLAFT